MRMKFMIEKNTHEYKKDVLRLATFIGQLMLSNGAETYRVDDTVKEFVVHEDLLI